jgi:toxin-antitoxin system PIN domain toxin
VKVPDVNLLLYALDPSAPRHDTAKEWLEHHLSGAETVGFAWVSLLGVIRLSTSPALFDPPLEANEALDVIEAWLAQPSATVISPTDRHASVLRELLSETGTAGNLTSDAHLASLAIEHGATLSSFDTDFHRFSGIKFEQLR